MIVSTGQRGQNFLYDQAFISEIINFAAPDFSKKIVEIGPGLGALTEKLAPAQDLTLIEIEAEFCNLLSEKYPRAKIINQDARKVDFSTIGSDLTVFGNLPYAFSTEIIFCLIENRMFIDKAVLLLQQEFAERMAAAPGSKTYGVLSISCQIWAELKLGPVIKGDVFEPPAKVNSRLIEMSFLKSPKYGISDFTFFKKTVKASFHQRRKKIINSLASAGFDDKSHIEKSLKAAKLDPSRRAETLSIEDFVKLSEFLRCDK